MSFTPATARGTGSPEPAALTTRFAPYRAHPDSPAAPRTARGRMAVLALPAAFSSVPTARRFVANIVARWGMGAEIRDAAELVVSELAGNAARHGCSEMTIRLADGNDRLHVTVHDSGRPPEERHGHGAGGPDEHGRGLAIVRSLARSVVVSRGPGGWRVDVVLQVPSPWSAREETDDAVPPEHGQTTVLTSAVRLSTAAGEEAPGTGGPGRGRPCKPCATQTPILVTGSSDRVGRGTPMSGPARSDGPYACRRAGRDPVSTNGGRRRHWREWLSEFAATAILLFVMVSLFRVLHGADSPPAHMIPSAGKLAIGALVSGLTVGLLVASPFGRCSGGHLNPAVSLAFWLLRALSGRDATAYIAAQLAGSTAGVAAGRLLWGEQAAAPAVGAAPRRGGAGRPGAGGFIAAAPAPPGPG
ncbi:ATP-binding protein, partial [Streptomyces sp. NPDC058964]|uniref:ATP-binding protein n=1 Tax=Streptomyces sp. NPDC058964 TaxID=3346681 RepID=UPI0036A63BBE